MRKIALPHLPIGLALPPLALVGVEEEDKLLLDEFSLLRVSWVGPRLPRHHLAWASRTTVHRARGAYRGATGHPLRTRTGWAWAGLGPPGHGVHDAHHILVRVTRGQRHAHGTLARPHARVGLAHVAIHAWLHTLTTKAVVT